MDQMSTITPRQPNSNDFKSSKKTEIKNYRYASTDLQLPKIGNEPVSKRG